MNLVSVTRPFLSLFLYVRLTLIFNYVCACVPVYLSVCLSLTSVCSWRPEESIRSYEAKLQVLVRHLRHWKWNLGPLQEEQFFNWGAIALAFLSFKKRYIQKCDETLQN